MDNEVATTSESQELKRVKTTTSEMNEKSEKVISGLSALFGLLLSFLMSVYSFNGMVQQLDRERKFQSHLDLFWLDLLD